MNVRNTGSTAFVAEAHKYAQVDDAQGGRFEPHRPATTSFQPYDGPELTPGRDIDEVIVFLVNEDSRLVRLTLRPGPHLQSAAWNVRR